MLYFRPLFLVLLFLHVSISLHAADQKVTLELKWLHQFQFAGFYMAKAKGYYAEAGLDVTIHDGYKKDVYRDVEEGRADFGISSSTLIYERLRGRPFVALGVIFQSSPFVWVVKKESHITKPADFAGKTVMYPSSTLDSIDLMAMLRKEGVNTDAIHFIPTSYDINSLINGDTDVFSAYRSNEPFELQQRGIDAQLIYPITYGLDFYGDVLFTSQKFLKSHPTAVKAFREASFRGWVYAFEHIDETIALIHEQYRPDKTLEHLRFEADTLKEQSLYPFVQIGHMNLGRWQHIAAVFEELGYLTKADIPENFIYNPNPPLDTTWIKIVFAITALVLVFMLFILYINRRHNVLLQSLVTQRTRELEQLNSSLEQKIAERTKALEEAMHEAQAANRSKSLFLANMSHEIRTPLNAILGFLEQLQQEVTDAKQRHYLEIIHGSSRSLLTVINDILDISKIEDGKITIEKIDCDLQNFITEVAGLFESQAAGKQITLMTRYQNTVPQFVRTDPTRLRQILSNLLANAIKFSPQLTRIEIIIAYHAPMLQCSVKDQGIGIDAKTQKEIFSPFVQAETSTARQFGGTGLGLSISKRLAEIMGGNMYLKSIPGLGSTFTFEVNAPEVAPPVIPEQNAPETGSLQGHILVAEDNMTNQMLVELLLNEMGLTYTLVGDGDAAIAALQQHHYDLILMDINMPKRDGISATQVIRSELHSDIPIIALTANAMQDDVTRYLEAGMNAHIAKPINTAQLFQTLSKFLPRS